MPVFLCLHQFVPSEEPPGLSSFICSSALFILQNASFINVFMCFLPARGCAPWLMGTWWTIWQIESLQEGHPRMTVRWQTASMFLKAKKMPPQAHVASQPLNQDFTINSKWPPGANWSRLMVVLLKHYFIFFMLYIFHRNSAPFLSRAAWKTSDFVVLCWKSQQIIVFLSALRQKHGQKPHM